jgi:group II intron reverse transcriptase/maturase
MQTMLKKTKLRYNEYFNMQSTFDELYQQSRNNNNFYKLIEIIGSEQNIRLAYRNLKSNSGSKTKGTDGLTICDIGKLTDQEMINRVRESLEDYNPKPVRRVYIPKPGTDKKRPLGIPTIWDRLIQQCILQVLEPICEPKFHNHSYGFRPNRSAHHAVSRMVTLINFGKNYYCVDIDIKGFFDNVNHGKLMKQLWTLGIRDKRLLCIISKLLKCEIKGEGIPAKGTPQGGILSPLLSNIVLNELDWWISDQWETYQPNKIRENRNFRRGARQNSNMKEGFLVRYADDFKVMCKSYSEAQRYYHAIVDFLNIRLGLEISPEKSKVTNLRKNSSDFLGFKIKVVPKGTARYGYVAKTDMCDKAKAKVFGNIRNCVLQIQSHTTVENITRYNSAVTGIQNYYKIATNIYNNLDRINYSLIRTHYNRLRIIAKRVRFGDTPMDFQKRTKGLSRDKRIYQIKRINLLPLTGVHHKPPMNFSQDICNFTQKGRESIHNNQNVVDEASLEALQLYFGAEETVEFRSNAISKYVAQYGKCYITGERLTPKSSVVIRIIPKERNGTDKYNNIVIVSKSAEAMIYAELTNLIGLDEKQKEKLNKLRMARKLKSVK